MMGWERFCYGFLSFFPRLTCMYIFTAVTPREIHLYKADFVAGWHIHVARPIIKAPYDHIKHKMKFVHYIKNL